MLVKYGDLGTKTEYIKVASSSYQKLLLCQRHTDLDRRGQLHGRQARTGRKLPDPRTDRFRDLVVAVPRHRLDHQQAAVKLAQPQWQVQVREECTRSMQILG